ncbi:Fe-S oxidoreductase [Desulfohalotomaculum tongense]|uniref:(Fe-S)-binding protein n=1 Tax=Desulforadius tongensis TaxID=1216062 RepID=UPI00195D36E6|nr:(Fe-S)-binding protein [Desulforadius tongensis]MBM7856221.1 Fe-S oxidoreductase [Desulforadius tongensis]
MAINAANFDPTFIEEVSSKLRKFDLTKCLTCGMCTAGCVYSDVHPDNDPRKFLRKVVLGLRDEVLNDPFVWFCTMCERCTVECPMGINIGALTRTIRGQFGLPLPGFMQKVVDETITSGNQMDVTQEDYEETLEWIEEELQEELGDPDYKIPIDVENADFLFGMNAREIKYYPHELQEILKVFYYAGANYTLSSRKWDATNLALFSGNNHDFWTITKPMLEEVVRLKAKELVVTECGHAFKSVRMGYKEFWEGPEFPVRSVLEVYADWIREGKLKVDKSKNPQPATIHDPCNLVRKEGVYDAHRYVMENICEDFRDMTPNKKFNYCCGAGGGALAMPEFKEQRIKKGKLKAAQIEAVGAEVVAIPCHNCMDQFTDINKEYFGMKKEMTHVTPLLANALVIEECAGYKGRKEVEE